MILVCCDCGLSFYDIATHIGQNTTTVTRIWNRWIQEGHTESNTGFSPKASRQLHRKSADFSTVTIIAVYLDFAALRNEVTMGQPMKLDKGCPSDRLFRRAPVRWFMMDASMFRSPGKSSGDLLDSIYSYAHSTRWYRRSHWVHDTNVSVSRRRQYENPSLHFSDLKADGCAIFEASEMLFFKKKTQGHLNTKGVRLVPWKKYCPDPSPVENIWSWVA
ncbi:hypothetical protein TNCV_169621 [Trichonephila clavipes]|nr:hypothetical protein TNCV_169621 [Trichonephila clavipes]